MSERMNEKQPEETGKKESDAIGLLCVVGVFFIPIFSIFVFVRLLITHGAPDWYLWVHGVLSGISVILVIHLIWIGIVPAVRDFKSGRRRERSNK